MIQHEEENTDFLLPKQHVRFQTPFLSFLNVPLII